MKETLQSIRSIKIENGGQWPYSDKKRMDELHEAVLSLIAQSNRLPSYLQTQMYDLQGDARVRYRTWIVLTWFTSFLAGALLLLMVRLFLSLDLSAVGDAD